MKSIKEIHHEIKALGTSYDMDTIVAGIELLAPMHDQEQFTDLNINRDIAYGDHERHVLDIYRPTQLYSGDLPVLLFLHGGGFVGGDKHRPNSPYNDNVGIWAARHNMVGVVMNYRLAPQHPYPAGAEDVNAALGWLNENVRNYNGNPEKIFVLGTSAGANHVASCVALPELENSKFIKAAGLMSCIYNIAEAERNDHFLAYFGDDPSTYNDKSSLNGVVNCGIPLFVTLAEYEPADFEKQCLLFINAFFEKHGRWPNFYRIMHHNHFTSSQHLNTVDDTFSKELLEFIKGSV